MGMQQEILNLLSRMNMYKPHVLAHHFRHFSDLFIAPKVPVEDDARLDPRAQSGLYPLYEVLNLLWVESLYRNDGEVCPIRDLLFSKFPRETSQNLKVLALDKYRHGSSPIA